MTLKDPVVRLVVVNWLLGMLAGLLCAGLVLWFDLGGLRGLLLRSDFWVQGLALLFGGFAVTFGSAVCGTAIMSLAKDDRDDGPGGGHREDEREPELALIPVPVRVRRK